MDKIKAFIAGHKKWFIGGAAISTALVAWATGLIDLGTLIKNIWQAIGG